jgi:hypothetical protein
MDDGTGSEVGRRPIQNYFDMGFSPADRVEIEGFPAEEVTIADARRVSWNGSLVSLSELRRQLGARQGIQLFRGKISIAGRALDTAYDETYGAKGPGLRKPRYERLYPTTGFWLFVCNTTFWSADKWLVLGETELLYKVSEHHATEMARGQFGLLRLNKDRRSRALRGTRPAHEAGIYALVEVVGPAQFGSDNDDRGYNDPNYALKLAWRVPLRVVANLVANPVLAASLPADEAFKHIREPLSTSTLAIRPWVYEYVAGLAGVSLVEVAAPDAALERLLSQLAAAIQQRVLNSGRDKRGRNPERQGPVGRDLIDILKLKWAEQEGRCLLCDRAISLDPPNRLLQLSPDRIDSAQKTYDPENLHLTHLGCNLAKSDATLAQWREFLTVLRG